MQVNKSWAYAFIAGVLILVGAMAPLTNSGSALAASDKSYATGHSSILRLSSKDSLPATRKVRIGVNKSMVVELPKAVRDVLVSNPKMLDAVVHTSNRVYLIGMKIGQANAFFFDQSGNPILTLEVVIERDVAALEDVYKRLIPGSNINVEALNETLILTGTVRNPADSNRAADIASRFVTRAQSDGYGNQNARHSEKIVNMISVMAKEQVMLKVSVVEVNRNALKQFGVNLGATIQAGNALFVPLTDNAFPVTTANGLNGIPGALLSGGVVGLLGGRNSGLSGSYQTGSSKIVGAIKAMERTGLLRTLAEPNLTAISGETAKFMAGGEFPIPVSEEDGRISVEWKPFGVSLAFTPVVLSEGRISLKVATEVSELSTEGAISLSFITLPGLKVRRADTTVELPSGGSLAIAGLLSQDVRQNIDGVPGLKNLPILGALFRSRDYIRNETELVIIVTPYLVNPVARAKLVDPDKGLAAASDAKASLLGELNRIYGRREKMPAGKYQGDYGFMIE